MKDSRIEETKGRTKCIDKRQFKTIDRRFRKKGPRVTLTVDPMPLVMKTRDVETLNEGPVSTAKFRQAKGPRDL